MRTASRIRLGICAVMVVGVAALFMLRAPSDYNDPRAFSNVGNTMANVGGSGYYAPSYSSTKSDTDGYFCLGIGFCIGVLITLMLTELLQKFEQACRDLAQLRMKYDMLCRERLAAAQPPPATQHEWVGL